MMHEKREAARKATMRMLEKSKHASEKFAVGTAQHTLLENRMKALLTACVLLKGEKNLPEEVLKQAIKPIYSLISKSEKAKQNLKQAT
ncbi:MAG: hypothetical protein ACOX3W_00800 [Christensenellaceae bacterium]